MTHENLACLVSETILFILFGLSRLFSRGLRKDQTFLDLQPGRNTSFHRAKYSVPLIFFECRFVYG